MTKRKIAKKTKVRKAPCNDCRPFSVKPRRDAAGRFKKKPKK